LPGRRRSGRIGEYLEGRKHLRMLLAGGANSEERGEPTQNTPMFKAAMQGRGPGVKLLLDASSEVSSRDIN
jgi:ankyrin repeat protein